MDVSFNYDKCKAPDLNHEGKFKHKTGRIHFYSYQGDQDKYAVAAKRIEGKQKAPTLRWYEKRYYVLQQDPAKKDVYYKINKASLKQRMGFTSKELSGVKDNNYVPLIQAKFDAIVKIDPVLASLIAPKELPQKPKVEVVASTPVEQPQKPTAEEAAATVFQKFLRGQKAREPVLPKHLTYDDYSKQVERAEATQGKDIPQASDGDTTVYLPKEMPEVVLKKSGRKEGVERFHQMQDVRKILNEMDCTHLEIPRANLYKDYLVETRLPINTSVLYNMRIYLSDPGKFDDAVREMTRLFSKVTLTDLVGPQRTFLNSIVGDSVRYDNLPLYIDKDGKGKIGLIDLEHLRGTPSINNLTLLARIFPLHQDIIVDEAKKLGLENIPIEDVQKASEKGKKYLDEGYTKHLQWSKNKGITPETALQKFIVTPERQKELTRVIQSELLKMNEGKNDVFQRRGFTETPKNFKNFLTDNPEEAANQLAPIICERILTNIDSLVEKRLKNQSDIDSEVKMLQTRSLVMDVLNTVTTNILPLRSFVEEETPIMKLAEGMKDFKEEVAARIGATVMEELVRGGEIFHFARDHISKQDATWVIRF